MSNPKKYNQNLPATAEVQNMGMLEEKTGNVYESIYIISKRSNQINAEIREELQRKLEEFATHNDNLEEIFENREQIEISRSYEKLPKSTLMSLEEFIQDKTYFRLQDDENNS